MDGDGSGSGDVSSTDAGEVPLADPEMPQPNASPPTGRPTENDVASLMRLFAGRYVYEHLVISRLPLSGPNMGSSVVFFRTRDGDEGGGDPPHGDGDGDADTDDDDDEDDAYDGFGFSFGAVPASGVAMACLPETTVGEGEASRESGECAVCLEEYEAGDELRTMPCAHGFHERCIFEWLRASRLCPLCRFKLPPEEDTETDGEEDERDAGHDDDTETDEEEDERDAGHDDDTETDEEDADHDDNDDDALEYI